MSQTIGMSRRKRSRKKPQSVHTKITILGILFLLLASIVLIPKLKHFSQAQAGNWPNSRYASAGRVASVFEQTYGSPYYYSWGAMYGGTLGQASSSHQFAWMVGNGGGGSSLNCNGISSSSCRAKIDNDFNTLAPKIASLLASDVNKGGVWIVSNEVNFVSQSYMSALDHAYQFKKYRNYIKSLDPSAELAHGSLLLIGWGGSNILYQWDKSGYDAKDYMVEFLSALTTAEYPDIYNIHLYSSGSSYYGNSVTQGQNVRSYLNNIGEGSKPLWVTEGGANGSGVDQNDVNSYMDNVAKKLTSEGTVARWFWYQGNCNQINGYCDGDSSSLPITALTITISGQSPYITTTGNRYAQLVGVPTATPTLKPTATPTPVDTTPPTVSITNPANGAIIGQGNSLTIKANASDNKKVTKVEFSVNSVLLCTDTSSGYSCKWTMPNAGAGIMYTLSAKAYDAADNTASSSVTVKSK